MRAGGADASGDCASAAPAVSARAHSMAPRRQRTASRLGLSGTAILTPGPLRCAPNNGTMFMTVVPLLLRPEIPLPVGLRLPPVRVSAASPTGASAGLRVQESVRHDAGRLPAFRGRAREDGTARRRVRGRLLLLKDQAPLRCLQRIRLHSLPLRIVVGLGIALSQFELRRELARAGLRQRRVELQLLRRYGAAED